MKDRGKAFIKRCGISFLISSFCGLIMNMLIEMIVKSITGKMDFSPLSPEFRAFFSSESMAVYTNILLYGVIGMTFSGFTFIYEIDKIGYIFQNILYYIATGIVWVPIVVIVWQLYRYPQALISTLAGFMVTDVIMTVVGYKIKKQEVDAINLVLEMQRNKMDARYVE